MTKLVKTYISLLFLFACNQLQAQVDTTIFRSKIRTFTINEKQIDRHQSWKALDTSITKNEIFNPMYAKYGIFQDQGVIGSAAQSLIFNYDRKLDFRFAQNPWEDYFLKPEDRIYYNSKSPITDITYAQGRNQMIYLKAKLAINVTPRWSIGADYFRLTSLGNFVHQTNGSYNTQVFSYYQSANGKYAVHGSLTWNLGYNQENGGLKSDSAFQALSGDNKTGDPKLTASENGYRNRSFYLKQYFYYGKTNKLIQKDDTINQFISYGHFSHTLKANEEIYYLRVNGDSDLSVYPNRYFSTTANTFDSIASQTVSNRLAYTLYNTDRKNEMRYIELAATHQYINNSLVNVNKYYNNVILEGTVEREIYTNYGLWFKAQGAYAPLGYNQNDLKLSGDIGYKTPWASIYGGLFNHLYTPDFTFKYYSTNQFIWNNETFNKINISNWHVGLQTRLFRNNFRFTYNQNILANWVYFGTDATPTQSDKIALVQTFEVQKTFQLWKFFFDNKLIYQKSSEDFIRLPELGAILRYYVQQALFKKAMNLQVGFDVFYNTAFYAQAYNPATRGFYLQNTREIGNYPLINVFACGEIRHAVLFAVYEHLNQDWFKSTGYYASPSNPLALSSFRLGVRWRMYN